MPIDENTLFCEIRPRIESVVGAKIVGTRVTPGGYSATQRLVMTTASGTTFFAKIGTTLPSCENIRYEIGVFERLHVTCMPRVLGWDTDHPFLLLEDLSTAFWPPPWNERQVQEVLHTVHELHAASSTLDDHEVRHGHLPGWWQQIAANPEPFLRLEIVSDGWLQRALPTLMEYESSCSASGKSLCHFDLRSDNICISPRGVIVIDWSHACRGNADLDLGLLLPGLEHEGGPQPEQILADAPGIAAWVSGFFAFHASKPFIPTAPLVRTMQRQHLSTALAWATRALRL